MTCTHDSSEGDLSSSFVERRRILTKNIDDLRDPQRLYIPGASSLSAIDPILLADHPERVELSLPSTLPSASRNTQCVDGLPRLEYRLRVAQAMDALHHIRLSRRLLRVLVVKSQVHITSTQKPGTRTRSVFDKAKTKLTQAVSTYRVSWKAIKNLAPNEEFGRWKDTLLELKDCDIRGPGQDEPRTSASRSVQSWIWTTALQTSTSAEDPDLNAALRVEWCKAQEQAKRHEEEVELVVEEMRRTLVTFELNACEWDRRATSPSLPNPTVEAAAAAGVVAYARKQANLQRKLITVFIDGWRDILEGQPLAASWFGKHPHPPKNQRRRLPCNVQLYHSAPSAQHVDTPGVGGSHSNLDTASLDATRLSFGCFNDR